MKTLTQCQTKQNHLSTIFNGLYTGSIPILDAALNTTYQGYNLCYEKIRRKCNVHVYKDERYLGHIVVEHIDEESFRSFQVVAA